MDSWSACCSAWSSLLASPCLLRNRRFLSSTKSANRLSVHLALNRWPMRLTLMFRCTLDRAFGSGCVKITGAHDFNDYACAQRHDLPLIRSLPQLPGRLIRRRKRAPGLQAMCRQAPLRSYPMPRRSRQGSLC
ncbi:MAG: hypothetical protein EBU79_12930 [Betaproteobacteria bacterium]|nr:hypothetical protein [Betaproteobacteria bacterium]